MRASLALAVLLATSLVAGCSSPPETQPSSGPELPATTDPWVGVQAAMVGVPCQADASGNGNSANLKLLSTVLMPASHDGIHAEIDIRGDLAIHARYGSSGFELFNITNPMAPVHLGNWTHDPDDGALDVKFSPDNATVLVGTGDSIHLVDVRDPLAPKQVGDWHVSDANPVGGDAAKVLYNSHMFYTKRIAGADWVFLAPNSNSGVWILKLEGGPDAPKLTYVTQTLPVEGGPLGPHDLYVQKDALDGHWYLYSADGFHGWTAFNVDNPASPMPAGGFANPAEGSYTHTIQTATINGKRIVATIGEVGANILRIYDATVMAAPIPLGFWQADTANAPGAPEHDINIAGGNLYVSYYTHGLYIFNLTAFTAGISIPAAGSATLHPVAHWAVPGESPSTSPLGFAGFWDTVVKDGVIYVSHIEGGLVVLGYGCNHAPDARLTSDG
ncbi:MAG: hypothetical protein V4510_11175 [bacterium]